MTSVENQANQVTPRLAAALSRANSLIIKTLNKEEIKMFKTIIATLFVMVLVIDFCASVVGKKIEVLDIIVRGFMVCACAYLLKGM